MLCNVMYVNMYIYIHIIYHHFDLDFKGSKPSPGILSTPPGDDTGFKRVRKPRDIGFNIFTNLVTLEICSECSDHLE